MPTCVDAEHPPTFDQMLSDEALLFSLQTGVAVAGAAGEGGDVLTLHTSLSSSRLLSGGRGIPTERLQRIL